MTSLSDMAKLKGLSIVFLILAAIIIGLSDFGKDSRSQLVQTFTSADVVEFRKPGNGPIIRCDKELRDELLVVLKTLVVTRHPPRQSCDVIEFLARSEYGRTVSSLRLLTTTQGQGLFSMAGEQNYSSEQLAGLFALMLSKHPDLDLRFMNSEGKCDR
jgi:hypothetical protein